VDISNEHSATEKAQLTALAKWRGGRARIWEYTPTLSRLTLRLESNKMTGNLHIVCGGCQHIRGPFHWDNCDLAIECAQGPGGELIHTIRDSHADFELRCWVVSLLENVEPVYSASLS